MRDKLDFLSWISKYYWCALVASLSVPTLIYTTKFGLGLEDDAAYYIAGARSIAHGAGFSTLTPTGYRSYITWFPPLYSFVLSLSGFVHIDPLVWARYLQIFIFFMSSFLLCHIIMKITQSHLAPIGVLFFIFSNDILFVHTMAWSEPLFIFLMLMSFMLFAKMADKPDIKYCAYAAILVGLSTLVRYAGVSLIATGFLVAFLNRSHKISTKTIRAVLFSLLASTPLILLFLRNKILGGAATNRTLSFHFNITNEQTTAILDGFHSWLNGYFSGFVVLAFITIFGVGVAIFIARSKIAIHPLMKVSCMFIAVYVPFLMTVTFLFDADMILSSRRIFSPLHTACIIVFVSFVTLFFKSMRSRFFILIATTLVGYFFLRNGYSYIKELHADGIEFAAKRWIASPTLQILRRDFPHMGIYTNVPSAIYIWMNCTCDTIPVRYDKLARQPFPDYDSDLRVMIDALQQRKALLVIFYNDIDDLDMPSINDVKKLISLKCLAKTDDGEIYSIAEAAH